jgi:hypothetical protein
MAADIPALLAMTFRIVMDQVQERLADEGFGDVRPAHGFVFQYLSHREGATAVDIGQHLGVTKQAAVRLVDDLEQRGCVLREPHPTDRHSRMVMLAPRDTPPFSVSTAIVNWRNASSRASVSGLPSRNASIRSGSAA